MRNRVVLALCLALLLVGGATWMRVRNTKAASPSLVSVDDSALQIYNEDSFWNNTATSSTIESKPASETDLIARSLLLDFVNLSTNGQATEENLTALADKYVQSIPTLSKAAVFSLADVKAVSNTHENFQSYNNQVNAIQAEFSSKVGAAYGSGKNLNTLGPTFYSFIDAYGKGYEDAAIKLEAVPVPYDLANSHLKLINEYLSSAAAMKALSEVEENSATAFAGMVTMRSNLEDEKVVIQEINQILADNGVQP